MINLKFNNLIYSIPSNIYEITIGQFEEILLTLNKTEINLVDKWFEIFLILNIPIEVINSLDKDEFIELTKSIKFDLSLTKVRQTLDINKLTYKAFEKEFNIKVKDLILIENMITLNPNKFIAEIVAIIYKSKDEENVKFDLKYIQNKANVVRNEVKANYCIALYNLISISILQKIKTTINETN